MRRITLMLSASDSHVYMLSVLRRHIKCLLIGFVEDFFRCFIINSIFYRCEKMGNDSVVTANECTLNGFPYK